MEIIALYATRPCISLKIFCTQIFCFVVFGRLFNIPSFFCPLTEKIIRIQCFIIIVHCRSIVPFIIFRCFYQRGEKKRNEEIVVRYGHRKWPSSLILNHLMTSNPQDSCYDIFSTCRNPFAVQIFSHYIACITSKAKCFTGLNRTA